MTALIESFVRADDGTELYLRKRLGPPGQSLWAVLCDGIACDGFIWKYLFDALAERVNVAHFNYRGHGRSRSPVDPTRIRVEDHAADLAAVRAELGDPEVVLFGHSMGCQVALESMREHGGGVRGLVLLCGAPGRVTHSFKGTDALAQILPRLIAAVDRSPRVARALWGSVPAPLALKAALALGEVDKELIRPDDLVPYLEHMVDIDPPMFLRMLQSAGEHSAEDLLSSIDVPALVVAGDRDSFTPPALAKKMADAMPKAKLLVTLGTHVVPLEHRELVEREIMELLERVEGEATERS
jgi:pimeloyl-ACP methyl ester carboxylesterase